MQSARNKALQFRYKCSATTVTWLQTLAIPAKGITRDEALVQPAEGLEGEIVRRAAEIRRRPS